MSIRVVVRYLGLILAIFGAFLLFPLFWSAVVARDGAYLSFVIPIVIALPGGLLLFRYSPVERRSLSRREGLALVTCTWLVGSMLGALPYMISGVLPAFADAFFETMSGFTTTGATVLVTVGKQPESILLWRNYSQWIGGMGIITFFVALFPVLGIGAARLFEAEMPGPQTERLRTRMVDTARALWILYLVLTTVLYVVLRVGANVPVFDSLMVTLATMPSGGFLHLHESMSAYVDTPFVTSVVTLFMLMTGMNYALYFALLKRRRLGVLWESREVRAYLSIFVLAAVVVILDLVTRARLPFIEALQLGTFQVASILTTTGFTIADYDLWPYASKAVLLGLMLVGGCAGSTAGGFKVIRLLVLAKFSFRNVVSSYSPRSVVPLRVGNDTVPESMSSAVAGMGALLALLLLGGFLFMSALGLDTVAAFVSVLAAVGNIGPGLGGVGPAQNYAFIPAAGKIVLSLLMLVGRLEFVTVLALVSRSFWKWR